MPNLSAFQIVLLVRSMTYRLPIVSPVIPKGDVKYIEVESIPVIKPGGSSVFPIPITV